MSRPSRQLFASAATLACVLLAGAAIAPSLALASGFSALISDRSTYHRGDQLRLCWLIPAAGTLTLTDHDASGAAQVLRSGQDGGSGCVGGALTGPSGHECEVLEYATERGSGSMQTCFEVTDEPTPVVQPVAEYPQLLRGEVSGPEDADLGIDGVGFQTFSNASHGVTIGVRGPDGSEVDSDEVFPAADGTLHVVLHTAEYAPGDYKVTARYSFINAYSGQVNLVSTSQLADGFTFTVE